MYKGHLTSFLLCKIDLHHLIVQTSALKQEKSKCFALSCHALHFCVKVLTGVYYTMNIIKNEALDVSIQHNDESYYYNIC